MGTRPVPAEIEPPRGLWPRLRVRLKTLLISSPGRDRRQQPDKIVELLGLAAGETAADIGAGSGYFSFRLARAVAPDGLVYAVDTDPDMLWLVQQRARADGLPVQPLTGGDDDPSLPEPADLLFLSHSYHHLPKVVRYMTAARARLRPDGRVAIVEYRKGTLMTRIFGHASDPAVVKRQMGEAGYELLAEHDFVKGQLFLVFRVAAG